MDSQFNFIDDIVAKFESIQMYGVWFHMLVARLEELASIDPQSKPNQPNLPPDTTCDQLKQTLESEIEQNTLKIETLTNELIENVGQLVTDEEQQLLSQKRLDFTLRNQAVLKSIDELEARLRENERFQELKPLFQQLSTIKEDLKTLKESDLEERNEELKNKEVESNDEFLEKRSADTETAKENKRMMSFVDKLKE